VNREAHHTATGAAAARNSAVQSGLPVVVKIRQRPDSCTGRPTIHASGSVFAACRHAWQAITRAAMATAPSTGSKLRDEPVLRACRAQRIAAKKTTTCADIQAQPNPRCRAGLSARGVTASAHGHNASMPPISQAPGPETVSWRASAAPACHAAWAYRMVAIVAATAVPKSRIACFTGRNAWNPNGSIANGTPNATAATRMPHGFSPRRTASVERTDVAGMAWIGSPAMSACTTSQHLLQEFPERHRLWRRLFRVGRLRR
jgi:hypothetical protein